jgi:hypothetical protein
MELKKVLESFIYDSLVNQNFISHFNLTIQDSPGNYPGLSEEANQPILNSIPVTIP